MSVYIWSRYTVYDVSTVLALANKIIALCFLLLDKIRAVSQTSYPFHSKPSVHRYNPIRMRQLGLLSNAKVDEFAFDLSALTVILPKTKQGGGRGFRHR